MKARSAMVLGVTLAMSAPCAAQSPAQRLADQARVQIDELNGDSAYVLLVAALRQNPTPGERLRSFTLLAFAELMRSNQAAARQAFEQALRVDAAVRIDTLTELHSDAKLVFEQARTIVGTPLPASPVPEARVVLLLTVFVPADTLVLADDPWLPIIVQSNTVSRTVTTIASAAAPARPLWTDTQSAAGRRRIAWPLRQADGAVWPDGLYVLRAQATDSNGQATPFEERLLRVARARADTQVHPPLLPASAFAPEALPRTGRTMPKLIVGAAVAALAAATPTILGNADLNAGLANDPTAYAVSGGVALASVVGFVSGRRPQRLPQNVQKNRELRDNDQRLRDAIVRANAEARAKAPIRITVERTP